jgi:hypothetical protein
MAAVLQFDTLDYARKLETAGVAAPQAELQARALAEALSQAVASPNDLKDLESNFGARFGALESRMTILEAAVAAVRSELSSKTDSLRADVVGRIDTLKWLFGVVAAMNIATFVRLVLHP